MVPNQKKHTLLILTCGAIESIVMKEFSNEFFTLASELSEFETMKSR